MELAAKSKPIAALKSTDLLLLHLSASHLSDCEDVVLLFPWRDRINIPCISLCLSFLQIKPAKYIIPGNWRASLSLEMAAPEFPYPLSFLLLYIPSPQYQPPSNLAMTISTFSLYIAQREPWHQTPPLALMLLGTFPGFQGKFVLKKALSDMSNGHSYSLSTIL